MLKRFAVAVFALIALSLTPVFAEEALQAPLPQIGAAVAQPGCGAATLDLSAEAQVCQAAQVETPEPEFMAPPFRRYCRCGCGATCTTDADCGSGGSCVAFITCC